MGDVEVLDNSSQIGQLFEACDLDGSGYIDQSELARLCTELTTDELGDVFKELDKDGDGRISVAEFTEGFKSILIDKSRKKSLKRGNSILSQGGTGDDFAKRLDEGLEALSCQENVCELYQQLHASDVPHLLTQFETIILSVIKDVRQQQLENQSLESSYRREKEHHAAQIQLLEDELEGQVQKIEQRVRAEERERNKGEVETMQQKYEDEIRNLQTNLVKLQGLQEKPRKENNQDGQVSKLKRQLEELSEENRELRATVNDAQTNLALVRSELAGLRQDHAEKLEALQLEKDTMAEYAKEQAHLTSQLQQLHEANRKLHDTNDDLRAALEQSHMALRKISTSATPGRFPNLSSPDSPNPPPDYPGRTHSSNSSLADEISQTESLVHCDPVKRFLPAQESCEVDSMLDDIDSGHSTLRDANDQESDESPYHRLTTPAKVRRISRSKRVSHHDSETEAPESHDEMETEIEAMSIRDGDSGQRQSRLVRKRDRDIELGSRSPRSRPGSAGSGSSVRSLTFSRGSRDGSVRRQLPTIPSQVTVNKTSDPERMYKVVLAGDAAVGKSSFIMRLCKGKFVANLNSTLGVDFQTKALDVDGNNVALQLWDTAGQERFRSIAKSYFRRADGVLLLYDVTYERSFINIRDWIDAIEDGAEKQIPIMMCANKTDAREEAKADGKKVVTAEDGQRLAREYNSLFIETSAKEGSNICEAVTELARWMKTNEDIEVKSVGLQLHVSPKRETKKKNCC
ncbi:ras and EF-hand domain-containing protein homolog [Lingula anatina]|uniref:Ras and EF-hand domain-containing protein homolog n=1 Tax=Lingula anatina TaxID=7574 RepID=A0A1S3J9U7_LINAN|nr:ras and EF-hand domain-containing protein homolog [Lingula anatina]XP_013406984.1 ras and EF-hand domain-containing protein homolog [Lingula anatina]XP_013406985.1 ras and EF-hand domain-containing protein homolog [Lingula anatina]XP_013406986.1 ras and EF-hand domain-containing protein homolog [Lingula anatina]|eukprot:XP_013406983.1 ras and EF-hand domain-containing protein homolog [Lingula anatina]